MGSNPALGTIFYSLSLCDSQCGMAARTALQPAPGCRLLRQNPPASPSSNRLNGCGPACNAWFAHARERFPMLRALTARLKRCEARLRHRNDADSSRNASNSIRFRATMSVPRNNHESFSRSASKRVHSATRRHNQLDSAGISTMVNEFALSCWRDRPRACRQGFRVFGWRSAAAIVALLRERHSHR